MAGRSLTVHLCRCSGNQHGLIRKYGLNMTRRDFREKAETMGWTKVGLSALIVHRISLAFVVCDAHVACVSCLLVTDFPFLFLAVPMIFLASGRNKPQKKR